jgi:hypothetical protein
MRLTLSQGCHQFRVGQGRPWRVEAGQTGAGPPEIVSSTTAHLSIRDGQVTTHSAGLRSQLRGAVIENPMEVVRGLVHGAPRQSLAGLMWRGVNHLSGDNVRYTPKTFTLERGEGRVAVGLKGSLSVGGLEKAHRWSETYNLDEARRWIRRTFQGPRATKAQLLSILEQLAPKERGLVTGLVEAQLSAKADASAALRAGQHRLPGGSCTIQINTGTQANLRIEMTGSTSRGKARLASATTTIGLSKPVQVSQPLGMLHALQGRRGTGVGRAVRRAVDRMLNFSVKSLQLERRGGARTRVRLKGRLKLFNCFSLGLSRCVTIKDANLPSLKPAELGGMLSSAKAKLNLELKPAGSRDRLQLETRPSLRFEPGGVSFTAPTEVRTPNVHGSYAVEGSHAF